MYDDRYELEVGVSLESQKNQLKVESSQNNRSQPICLICTQMLYFKYTNSTGASLFTYIYVFFLFSALFAFIGWQK